MGTVYATVDDLIAYWRPLTSAEQTTAQGRLAEASVMLRGEDPALDARIESGAVEMELVTLVTCRMARRAMLTPEDEGEGVAQISNTGGPFTRSVSYANPSGDVYLTRADRRQLGIRAQRAGSIDLLAGHT